MRRRELARLTKIDRAVQHERVLQATGMLRQVADDLRHTSEQTTGEEIQELADEIWELSVKHIVGPTLRGRPTGEAPDA